MFDMDFSNEHNDLPMNTDPYRPPQHNPCNIPSSCGQVYGGNEGDANADARYTQVLLRNIVQEQAMLHEDLSADDGSSSDGDEGLDDHLRGQHSSTADVGHEWRLMTHHYHCECPICPYRVNARINEWMLNAAIDPETPGSMYPEQGSGELSMASSMFLETRPPTPGQLLAEMASWTTPAESAGVPYHDSYEYITSPLWLVPERMVPNQLDTCIPEESEPATDDEL